MGDGGLPPENFGLLTAAGKLIAGLV